jgi:anti-anti-sigma factor
MPEGAQPLRVKVTWNGVTATVTLTGDLDATGAPRMTECLMKVAEIYVPGAVVLDLRGLLFVDVAGGRALALARKALGAECPVIVRWPPPSACKVILLGGFMGQLVSQPAAGRPHG